MCTRPRRFSTGITLIELMVTVAVLAVLLSLAAPSFRDLLAAQRIRAAAHSLVSDLVLARSEAVKRGASVTLSPATAGWHGGWSVTVNAGADTLSAQNPAGSNVEFSRAPDALTFDRNGRIDSLEPVRFEITYSDVPRRCVSLDPSGRPKSALAACPA